MMEHSSYKLSWIGKAQAQEKARRTRRHMDSAFIRVITADQWTADGRVDKYNGNQQINRKEFYIWE